MSVINIWIVTKKSNLFFKLFAIYRSRYPLNFPDGREGREPKGTTYREICYAKKLFESSFHPDSGELQNVVGRMSFQVPGGMLITATMLQFYRLVLSCLVKILANTPTRRIQTGRSPWSNLIKMC